MTNIKAVGNADVTYGLAVDGEKVTRKELTIEATLQHFVLVLKKSVNTQRITNVESLQLKLI